MQRGIQSAAEPGVSTEKIPAGRRQVRATPRVTSARSGDQFGAARPLGVVQVPEGVAVGPSHPCGGAPERAGGLHRTEELDPSIPDGEPSVRLEPDFVPDAEPI